MIIFTTRNPCCVLFAVPLIWNCNLELAVQFIHIIYVYDEVFKMVIQGYSLCLLANQLKLQLYRPGAKYIEKYSNTLQLLSLINDYNYITIAGHVEM